MNNWGNKCVFFFFSNANGILFEESNRKRYESENGPRNKKIRSKRIVKKNDRMERFLPPSAWDVFRDFSKWRATIFVSLAIVRHEQLIIRRFCVANRTANVLASNAGWPAGRFVEALNSPGTMTPRPRACSNASLRSAIVYLEELQDLPRLNNGTMMRVKDLVCSPSRDVKSRG